MSETGMKITELVALFNLEVLNRGSDYDTAILSITDVNRPGLLLAGYDDYFDRTRIQILGNAEMGYLHTLPENERRRTGRKGGDHSGKPVHSEK